ncbi:TadE/TadG family type IV pilus assembly protein [Sphingomonas sp.]|uniref:TadE/TadG family type IV pilus assembly protein n=1 Tax=Sphingomonas sp. TaxID=28214 RepID=UPI002B5B8C25|nr:TadE/TadG family type IV pilus assembly protein [Sphingomonas sp.]HTG39681.1 TadE/TadG family type IV pilus assembly protein [Sphingomonas sp.]
MTPRSRPNRQSLRALLASCRAVVLIEFAFTLPLLLLLGLTGIELTNYVITRMRISQIALHLADNAARIGTGTQLQQKTINEVDVNDLLTGAGYQAGALDLFERGRVIVSSVENDPANNGRYRIRWQRCRGAKNYDSPHDNNKTNLAGVGPAGRQVIAAPDGATMWVEVAYDYRPVLGVDLMPDVEMLESASMMVRDRRALTPASNVDANGDGVLEVQGEQASTC